MAKKKAQEGGWRGRDPEFTRERERYQHPVPSRRLILADLEAAGQPLSRAALLRQYALRRDDEKAAFEHRLGAMLRDGQLVENRKGALGPIQRMDLVRGRVQGHRDGFGFLIPEAGGAEDVFLNPRQMRLLMHGDRATVRIVGRDRRGKPEGRVVDVLERANTRVVGRFVREHGVSQVVPDNPRIQQDILVPEDRREGAEHGQIVTVELLDAPGKRSQPVGAVVEVLGEHLAPGMEIDIAVRAHGIPFEWPGAALEQANAIGDTVPRRHYRNREDLRDLPLVTIDGDDARDFDDAVCCRATASGWKLWVAIADVSAYVPVDSPLDREAHNRGTSVYFPERVVPMLPESLSNGLCSLNPEVDRLCLVCEMRINRSGEIGGARFYPAVMRSHARLTYDAVAGMLDGSADAAGLAPQIKALDEVYQALAQARSRRGAIDFESTETRIVFDEQRKIERIEARGRNPAHRLIEECMIAANVAAARFLDRRRMPFLYRVHAGPSADGLQELREFLAECGLSLGGGAAPQAQDYARLLAQTAKRDDRRLIQTVLLRSLARAVYSPDNEGHFGLALGHYAHFTSPIRRYPDLLVHRAIKHALAGGKAGDFAYDHGDMTELGGLTSAAETRADEATRDVDDWLKCEYLRDHIGEQWNGTITGVTAFGLFVELDDIFASGLVHVSSLANDYYHFDPRGHCLRGERSGIVHRLADRMRVKVARVDLDERKLDFEPVQSGGDVRRRRGPKKRR
ncbi:MAG: ribonuclease R [Salinisphaera sp.]|nr:ribonuclease R [Salinisphaera sp.]